MMDGSLIHTVDDDVAVDMMRLIGKLDICGDLQLWHPIEGSLPDMSRWRILFYEQNA